MNLLFIIAVLFLSVDILFISMVAIFINKTQKSILQKIFILPFTLMFSLAIGLFLGLNLIALTTNISYWYAATILFILSIKFIHSNFKLLQHKQRININDNRGLIIIVFTIFFNSLLCGIAFGLIGISYKMLILAFILSIIMMIIGIVIGKQTKKLYNVKYDFLSAIVFLVLSIFIIFSKNL